MSQSFSESTSVPSMSNNTACMTAILSWVPCRAKIVTIPVTGATGSIPNDARWAAKHASCSADSGVEVLRLGMVQHERVRRLLRVKLKLLGQSYPDPMGLQ